MTEIELLKEEIAWRTKAMSQQQAYIDKVLREYERLEKYLGPRVVIELELAALANEEIAVV